MIILSFLIKIRISFLVIDYSKAIIDQEILAHYRVILYRKIRFGQQAQKPMALLDSGFTCPTMLVISIHQSYWWY
jgi:hypothetical protein